MRVAVRRTPEQLDPQLAAATPQTAGRRTRLPGRPRPTAWCGWRHRWSASSTAPLSRGRPPFVQEGDTVTAGQTLCILEAMKLMNEIKADTPGVIREIHVGNAEPVEFGQLLFELEPLAPQPLDAV